MSKFDKAFSTARKSGAKVFSFGGKSYNTKLASDAPVKKAKAKAPATAPVPVSRPAMQKAPSYNREQAFDAMKHSTPAPAKYNSSTSNNSSMGDGVTSIPSPGKSHSFFVHKMGTNRSAMNDFKESESRRSSDYSIGRANAPKVKKAIGKFMLGKGYKD